jgi:hypothetical protein
MSGRMPLHLPHPRPQTRSARRQALREQRPQAPNDAPRREVRPVRCFSPGRQSARQQSRRSEDQASNDADASVDSGPSDGTTDSEVSGRSASSLHGGTTSMAQHTLREDPLASPFQEPRAVVWPGVGGPIGSPPSGVGVAHEERWQEASASSHADEPVHGDAMLADVQADLPQPLLNDGYLESLPNIASPFETSSWMDFDFLGNLAPETDKSGGQPDPPQGQANSPPMTGPSVGPVAWSAWRTLAREALIIMDGILAVGAYEGEGGPQTPQAM